MVLHRIPIFPADESQAKWSPFPICTYKHYALKTHTAEYTHPHSCAYMQHTQMYANFNEFISPLYPLAHLSRSSP